MDELCGVDAFCGFGVVGALPDTFVVGVPGVSLAAHGEGGFSLVVGGSGSGVVGGGAVSAVGPPQPNNTKNTGIFERTGEGCQNQSAPSRGSVPISFHGQKMSYLALTGSLLTTILARMLSPLLPPRSTMSRTHAESHKRIKRIAAEIDRLLTRLRTISNEEEAALRIEVSRTAEAARGVNELSEWAVFLSAHMALIARGGAQALFQSAVGLSHNSLVALAADEWALGRSWKINWLRRTQRPKDWGFGASLRTVDLEGYREAAWVHLGGGRLLSPSLLNGLRIQSTIAGELLQETSPERRKIEAILRLPNERALIAGEDGSLQLWTFEPLVMQARQSGHSGAILSLRSSVDGITALTLGADGELHVWSVDPLKKIHTLRYEGRPPREMELSPGASYAALGFGDGRIELIPTGERGKRKVLGVSTSTTVSYGHEAPIERILVRKNRLISSDNHGKIWFWAMPSGEPIRSICTHDHPVGFLWLDDTHQQLLSSSVDKLCLHSAETGDLLLYIQDRHGGVSAACRISEDRIALGMANGAILLLELRTDRSPLLDTKQLPQVGQHEGPVTKLDLAEDLLLLSCGLDRSARLWSLHSFHPTPPQARILGLNEDGLRALCVTTTEEVEYLDFAEGKRLRKIPVEARATPLPLLPWRRVIFDIAPPTLPLFGSAPESQRRHLLRVVETESWQTVLTLEGHRHRTQLTLVDEASRWIVTATSSGEIKLWDFHTGVNSLTISERSHPIMALAFEPGGIEMYALYAGNDVCVWSTKSGKLMRRISLQHAPEQQLTKLRAVGGHELLMAGEGGEVGRWDVESGKRIKGWRAHPGEIHALVLDSDGEVLATGGEDRCVRLWRKSTGRLLAQYDFSTPVVGCQFLPDGRLAAWTLLGEPHYLKLNDWAQDES